MTKIIPVKNGLFLQQSQRPLTPSMIRALQEACMRQSKNETFGPKDMKGSFTSLINRGFIKTKTKQEKGNTIFSWYVTPAAIQMLRDEGINDVC